MSTIPGLFVGGEANFSDHGANRLGASALMQGLADGYFVLPLMIGDYIAQGGIARVDTSHDAFRAAEQQVADLEHKLLSIKGRRTVNEFHRELGALMWNYCGMARTADGLKQALARIPQLREEFWQDVNVPGSGANINQSLEHAGRVADFLEFAELMCLDALERDESAGGHFRAEHQTGEGEAKRNDQQFAYVAVWEFTGVGRRPNLHKEPLTFEYVKLAERSYK
jgi:succinate dehydrogenase / fumarate reductase flavoprotein subunit